MNNLNFYDTLINCKISISQKEEIPLVGLVKDYYVADGDVWLNLIPFEATKVESSLKKLQDTAVVNVIPLPIFKKLSSITTIIILEKPNENNGNNPES